MIENDNNLETRNMARYNGWANYETWRINLEMFDGYDATDFLNDYDLAKGQHKAVRQLADHLEDMATEILDMECPNRLGFVYNLVASFLNKVDFQEIAEHMINHYITENA
jgi:hypothetical protein